MWQNIRLMFKKEITGALRDRRTMLLTIIFPLIFYPMVLAVVGHFTSTEQRKLEELTPAVIAVDRSEDELFRSKLRTAESFVPVFYQDREEALADLRSKDYQVMMVVEKTSGGPGLGLDITLRYDQTDQLATLAAARVREFLQDYLQTVLRQKLASLGLDYDELSAPLSINIIDTASSESVGRMLLSRLLPYFMILAILTGAMGLGAEITAGEKERGTIATLLVSQLSRTEIVLGKFFTILTVSIVSSLLSVVGLLIGIRYFGGNLAPSGMEATFALDFAAFGWMFAVLVPLAVILAALVMIVGTFARSQKEASTYLMPIYMVIVLVGIVSMTGGVTFAGARFLIPVANSLYILQEIIVGGFELPHFAYTLSANTVCGGLLIFASIQLFKRETILFRS